jgi:hypothetical protein
MPSQSPSPQPPSPARPAARSDRSPWNWLLVPPAVVPLIVPLFDHASPRIAGFPAFYWIQFAFAPLSVLCTVAVYRATRKRG